ncbi:MAG TPA: VOC family protein [Candidatus Saccharimonadales bacterium]|nr:VOC family protein [Candidatus Saccharimonadales bacterium]
MPSLDAIGIVTKDVAAAIRFYGLLGVAFPEPEGDHVEATLPNGLRLMLDTLELIKKLDPEWTEPKGHRMNLAFRCADPAEVDAVHAKVTNGGYASKTAPWDAFWGQRYAQVVDPDGNVVDLFAPLPR